MAYETVLVDTKGQTGLITLNRPKSLNALNSVLIREIAEAMEAFDADDKVGCIVVTGNEKAFAAGADIKEMQTQSYMDVFKNNFLVATDRWCAIRKPMIAAVSGYALGGGCELAMICDFILAADSARFGQPEITLGVMPGIGGTQRLARFVGKSKAMEMCLTGRMMDAEEAERSGLVARIVPADELLEEALKVANKIAEFSMPVTVMTKDAINRSYETSLAEGLRYERGLFRSQFSLDDQKEGMAAFVEKRTPQFKNK